MSKRGNFVQKIEENWRRFPTNIWSVLEERNARGVRFGKEDYFSSANTKLVEKL